MAQLSTEIQPKDIANDLDKYEFKCETVLIVPQIEIYLKETGKRVAITEMNLHLHQGNMIAPYANDFFKDIIADIPKSFAAQVVKKIKTRGTKTDGETQK